MPGNMFAIFTILSSGKTNFTFHSTLVFELVMFCSHVFKAMIGLWSKVLASHTWDY
ncbi:uncharacterized protein J3R85_005428 [Psidium guajava]|nr:uncharacterized protein J3R85_005428 [Psidium guajava]